MSKLEKRCQRIDVKNDPKFVKNDPFFTYNVVQILL